MDKIPAEIENILKIFLLKTKENNISIKSAYLFGSTATGKNNELSDIDIALVSDDFEGIRFLDKQSLYQAVVETDISIEPITFKVCDFNNENPIVSEILNTGININYLI